MLPVARTILTVLLFGLIHLLFGRTPSFIHRWRSGLARFLLARETFGPADDDEHDTTKIAVVRILLGVVLLARALTTVWYAFPGDWQDATVWVPMLTDVGLSLLLIAGIATPLVLLALVFGQWQLGEYLTLSGTLGNDVAAMLGLFLLFAGAGRTRSVDARWLQADVGPIRSLYAWFGPYDAEQRVVARFLMVGSYALLCTHSLSEHVHDATWLDGTAGPVLLASPFMDRWGPLFEQVWLVSPLAMMAGRASMFVQMTWFGTILPFLLLGGWPRRFAIGWGILFFILSAGALQLGSLAAIEALMWFAAFAPASWVTRRVAPRPPAEAGGRALPLQALLLTACLTFLWPMYVLTSPWPHRTPLYDAIGPTGVGALNTAAHMAHVVGVAPIDVFNQTDLKMAEHWFAIHDTTDGRNDPFPVFDALGGRRHWHHSDRIYYGHTLRWRRRYNAYDEACHELPEYEDPIFLDFIDLYRVTHPDARTFRVDFLYRPLPPWPVVQDNRWTFVEPRVVCSITYDLDRPDQGFVRVDGLPAADTPVPKGPTTP